MRADSERLMRADSERGTSPLHALAAQLDTIFDSAPVAIGLFDRQVRHVRVNALLADLNGLPAAALVGRTPAELHGPVGEQAEVMYREVMQTGEPRRDVPMSGEVGSRPGDRRHWTASFAPVRQDGEVLGLLVTVADDTQQRSLAEALERSEEQHRLIAEDLQRGLLPPVLPQVPGAELATVYRPSADGATVGGDFYDVLVLSPTSWALVIGDVQGKGPVAATMTAAVRYAVRAATVTSSEPAAVLRIVNEVLLRDEHDVALCTVAYVLCERIHDRIRVRSVAAGHPLPLVLRRSSPVVEPLGPPGTLLGTVPDLDLVEGAAELGTGDALVLYTDGATEARVPTPDGHLELFGDARLHATIGGAHGASAAAIAARLESAVLDFQDGRPADDLAVLVLRATDDPDR